VIGVTLVLVALTALADFFFEHVDIISHLYYLPILLAATQLGRRYALGVAGLAVVLAHLADPDLSRFHYAEADVMELLLFMTVAIVASRLTQDARELRRLASTDDLTGLHNLRSFEAISRALIERQRLSQGAVAMLALDIDGLKRLNDSYGHLTGSDAVQHVGKVLASVLPPGAQACRYGGDEFAVVMAEESSQQTAELVRQIQDAVAASAPVLDTRPFPPGTLSVSVGCASSSIALAVATASAFTQLFRQADEAMYAHKRSRSRHAALRELPGALASPSS